MTLRKDILLDAPCLELLCGICGDILEDPMQAYCPEDHMFCSSCLLNYKESTCPSCMEPLEKSSFQLSKFVKRQISRLRIRCVHQPLGCAWEGMLEDFHSHSLSCQYHSTPCPNSLNGCPDYIKPSDLYQHKSQCLYELIPCPNGSTQCQPFLRKDSALHDSICSSFRCPFAHEGCPFIGIRMDVDQHCEKYCGKLHERIKQLEQQCDEMKQQLNQQPDTNTMNDILSNAINDTPIPTTTPTIQDASMDEMSLFHQMFNNGLMSITAENNGTNINLPSTINNINNTEMMDLSASLPNISLPADQHQHQLADDTFDNLESRMTMTATAPKRSTNGKIIRYSRNKHLAHGALRMARQRTTNESNLTTEAILQALQQGNKKSRDGDVNMLTSPSSSSTPSISSSSSASSSASSSFPAPVASTSTHVTYTSSSTSTHQQPSSTPLPNLKPNKTDHNGNSSASPAIGNPTYSFNNLDDVTKFLEELPPMLESTTTPSEPPPPPSTSRKSGSTKSNTKLNNNYRTGNPNGSDSSEKFVKQPRTPTHTNSPSQNSSSTTNGSVMNSDKSSSNGSSARPMYVLASTLLSKRSQGS